MATDSTRAQAAADDVAEEAWLARFHAGDRRTLEACYREHFALVDARVGRYLAGSDRETVVHEIFFRLLSEEDMRRSFRGGSLAAWLGTVASHRAIDVARRSSRERSLSEREEQAGEHPEGELVARVLLARFRSALPPDWLPVFEARFVEQRSQREAAARLGILRTTLAYRELRIRQLLSKLVGDEP